ncbi:glycosyltransferase family 2 protein [Patescibacteria group bacterium]
MKKKMMLSVVIIAKNEETMIKDCLESVRQLADEIILIDSGSVDKTCQIAKRFQARIVADIAQGVNFSRWRNRGLKEAQGEWIFYLDADERATPALGEEIKKAMRSKEFSAYEIPRRNFYLGQEMRFGGAWPDYVKRLYLKTALKRWERDLHEDPVFEGKISRLKEPMIHLTHRDLSSMVEKTKKWSKIEANLLYKDYPGGHPPVTWWRILRMMLTEFWYRGIKLQGIRDGTVGWIEVIFQMFSRFMTYARLWEIQRRNRA